MAHITAFLDQWSAKFPEKTALISGDQKHSWKSLRERVAKLAGALNAMGLKSNTDARVFVLDKNVGSTIELTLACAWAGAACVVGTGASPPLKSSG